MTTPNAQALTPPAAKSPAAKQTVIARVALAVAAALLIVALVLAVPAYQGLASNRQNLTKAQESAENAVSEAEAAQEAVTKLEKEHPGISEWPSLKEQATQRCETFSESILPRGELALNLFEKTLTTSELIDEPVEARVCPEKYLAMANGSQAMTDTHNSIGTFQCVDKGGGVVTVSGKFTAKIPKALVDAGLGTGTFKLEASASKADKTKLVTKELSYKANPDQSVSWSATLTNVPSSATGCTIGVTSWWPEGLK